MTFAVGDVVHVAGLGTGVVREVINDRRFRVEIKGRVVVARAGELQGGQRGRTASRTGSGEAAAVSDAEPEGIRNAPPRSLDLHGRTVSEAIEALSTFLNDALLGGCSEVRIIHGRSGGRIKTAVHAALRGMAGVRFRLDPRNEGVTIVTL